LIIEYSVMLLVFVKTLFLSVLVVVNSVPCAVDAVSWDRKLDRNSSPGANQGAASRVGVGAMTFACATGCHGVLVAL